MDGQFGAPRRAVGRGKGRRGLPRHVVGRLGEAAANRNKKCEGRGWCVLDWSACCWRARSVSLRCFMDGGLCFFLCQRSDWRINRSDVIIERSIAEGTRIRAAKMPRCAGVMPRASRREPLTTRHRLMHWHWRIHCPCILHRQNRTCFRPYDGVRPPARCSEEEEEASSRGVGIVHRPHRRRRLQEGASSCRSIRSSSSSRGGGSCWRRAPQYAR